MTPYLQILTALLGATAAITLYAIMRRFIGSGEAPQWLGCQLTATVIAFVLTVGFAVTMVSVGMAAAPVFKHAVAAGVFSFLAHIALWAVIRELIPAKSLLGGCVTPGHAAA